MSAYWMLGMGVVLTGAVCAQAAAQSEAIPLWPDKPPHSVDDFVPTLTPMLLPGDEARGAVIVVPGGGYGGRAEHERTPIGQFFNEAGYHAFLLDYRVSPNRHPAPLSDAKRAVQMVRSRAEEWRVKPDKIAVLGFSAGGHLTGSVGVFFDEGDASSSDPVARVSSRPDAIVLCYAVLSSGKFGHQGSFDNLLGKDSTAEEREGMSLEKHVRENTPPTFLWSTADDQAVPVENSLLFAAALREKGVPFEMHVFPHGRHGLGLAPESPDVAQWAPLCAGWLKRMGW